MASLQEIGLAALIYNERWQEVRRELQWNPEIFRTFRIRQPGGAKKGATNNDEQETVFHMLCSKGERCPLDLLESVLNIAPDLVKVNSEALLQSLIQNQMWKIVLVILKFYPDIVRTSLFATRKGQLITTLHLLCMVHPPPPKDNSLNAAPPVEPLPWTGPPMNVVVGVIQAAPEALQWRGPGIPLHYAVHACCTEPVVTRKRLWMEIITVLIGCFPAGVAVPALGSQQERIRRLPGGGDTTAYASTFTCGCTPLVLAVSLGASLKLVQLLIRSCPKALLSNAGLPESYQSILQDPTLYANRDEERKEILDCLRPGHILPAVAVVCSLPMLVAAIAQPRYLRTSLSAMAVFNLAGGSKWFLEHLEARPHEQRGRQQQKQQQQHGPTGAKALQQIQVPELIAVTPPGLSLKFHDDSPLLPRAAAAAAVATASPHKGTGTTASPDACVVCWDANADHALIPCGHVCLCRSCSGHLRTTLRNKCPVCNGRVQNAMKIFGAGIAAK